MRASARKLRPVDDVAAIGRQRHAALRLGVRRTRLGELPGHAADLHHRQRGAERQHHRHLQQHAEHVADDVGGEIGETLGAVAALQHQRLAFRGQRKLRLEPPRLAGEHQRRIAANARFHGGELLPVRIVRHLADRAGAPGVGGPGAIGLDGHDDGLLRRRYVAILSGWLQQAGRTTANSGAGAPQPLMGSHSRRGIRAYNQE